MKEQSTDEALSEHGGINCDLTCVDRFRLDPHFKPRCDTELTATPRIWLQFPLGLSLDLCAASQS